MSWNSVDLSRREREIMDIVFSKGEATANEILAEMKDSPSNAAVRTHLRILEDKGHLKHRREGARFVFSPTEARETVCRLELKQLVQTYFGGSLYNAAAALVNLGSGKLSPEELNHLDSILTSSREKTS